MSHIIQVRCNGPNKDVNEVDLDQFIIDPVITAAFRIRVNALGRSTEGPVKEPPQRWVLDCKICKVGKVIITPEMIQSVENP